MISAFFLCMKFFLKFSVFSIYGKSSFELATFQVFSSCMWLLANVLDEEFVRLFARYKEGECEGHLNGECSRKVADGYVLLHSILKYLS